MTYTGVVDHVGVSTARAEMARAGVRCQVEEGSTRAEPAKDA